MKHRRFATELRKKELLKPRGLVFEPPDADENRNCARPARKAGRFGVEEQRSLKVDAFE